MRITSRIILTFTHTQQHTIQNQPSTSESRHYPTHLEHWNRLRLPFDLSTCLFAFEKAKALQHAVIGFASTSAFLLLGKRKTNVGSIQKWSSGAGGAPCSAHDVFIPQFIQNYVHIFNIFERVNGTDVCLSTICTLFLITSLMTTTVFSSHYLAGQPLSTVCVYSFLYISDLSPLEFVYLLQFPKEGKKGV